MITGGGMVRMSVLALRADRKTEEGCCAQVRCSCSCTCGTGGRACRAVKKARIYRGESWEAGGVSGVGRSRAYESGWAPSA